jgi:CDP-L-myo-inositol myo-inositolphosphotransferase
VSRQSNHGAYAHGAYATPWALVLSAPNGDPLRPVAGLGLALRLALDAGRAGATAIVLAPDSGVTADALSDARLRIPVVTEAPAGASRVEVAGTMVVHRALLGPSGDGSVRRIRPGDLPDPAPMYAFPAVDVTDARSAAAAEKALFRSLRKPQDGWTSRHLNRYLSLSLSRLLVKTRLTPNQVSVGILFIGLLGAWLAAQGTWETLALGALLFQTQSVLDGCDGEMSRVTYRGSLTGEWLDTIGDDLTNYGFFAGAAFGLHARTGSSLSLMAGAVVVGCGVVTSLIEYRYLAKIGSGDLLKYPASQATTDGTGPLAFVAPLFKRDTFVLLTLIAALLDIVGPVLVVFALAAVGILLNVLRTEIRLAKEARS